MSKSKALLNFEGLYGDSDTIDEGNYIFLELIATRSKNFDWQILPHFHSHLFQFFAVKSGQLKVQIEAVTLELKAPCLLLFPATVLHGLVYTPDIDGYILTLSAEIVEEIFPTSSPLWESFQQAQLLEQFDPEFSFQAFVKLIQEIEVEIFSEKPARMELLKALFRVFFIQFYRQVLDHAAQQKEDLMMGYYRKFQNNIKKAQFPKSIPQFAAELQITPVHLNRVCRAVGGKAAIQLIQEHLVGEGKKYLIHTAYSVSEIAYLLNFEYPNYFARLFKKHTGLTPLAFRESVRKKQDASSIYQ